MAKGEQFPAEWRTFTDRETGILVRQLTQYKGHSHHLYFTNPGWYDGGAKLLFGSDRANRTNLYSLDLASGAITQLTDRDQPPPPAETSFLFTSVNPRRAEAYYWHGRDLIAINLTTRDERPLYRAPDGYLTNMTNVTADGAYVCTGLYADLSDRFPVDLLHGYVGFREYFEAKPHSQIVRIATDTGKADVVFEEHSWIGHVNTSPTLPGVLTYCHEGPWEAVDNRIWGLNLATGRVWPIRQRAEGERVGHEYWFADGEHLGYHGAYADGTPFYGCVRWDDTDRVEAYFPHGSTHFHSNDLQIIVGDGNRTDPRLLLWRFHEGRFEGPRVVLTHHGSFHTQVLHVHPRFSPDGRQILFASDANGYGNLHLVDVPEFDALPALDNPSR